MKGKSFRRRQKNLQAAKTANLYKAQFGKASKWDALPEAPQARDIARQSRTERKMRAMLDLMAADCVQKPSDAASAVAPHLHPDTSGRSCIHSHGAESAPGVFCTREAGRVAGVDVSTIRPVAQTKAKRNDRLRQWKKRCKAASCTQVDQKGVARGFLPESRSQQTASKDPFHAEPILFGEVAKQPPDVNLKRRHWTNHESNSYSRHADLFQKHLQIGEAQLKAVAQRTHTTASCTVDQRGDGPVAEGVWVNKKSKSSATMKSLKALVQAGSRGLS